MNFSQLIPFRRRGTHVVVDIGSSSVKLATVYNGSRGQTISATMVTPLPPGSVWNGWIRDPTVVARAIEEYTQGQHLKAAAAITALPGRAMMIKVLELSGTEIVDLETTIEFQAMELIPANLDDVFLDYHVTQETKENKLLTVLLTAAKKELVESYMAVLSEAGLIPKIADVDYFALQNLCDGLHATPYDQMVCVLHIGANVTTVNITGKGVPLLSTDVQTAGQFCTDRIARGLGVSFEEAEKLKIENPIRSAHVGLAGLMLALSDELAHELKRAVSRFTAMNGNLHIDRLLVCGGGAKLPGLGAKLSEKFSNGVEPCKPLLGGDKPLDYWGNELPPEFAVVGGLAMRQPWQR